MNPYTDLKVHERLNLAINILNGIQLQGFHEFNVVAPALAKTMAVIAALDQDMVKAEQGETEKADQEEVKADA